MRVNLPFTWHAEYLAVGGSKATAKVFAEMVEVDIPEYDVREASAVASWTETAAREEGPRNRVVVRMVGDDLYRQAANPILSPERISREALLHGIDAERYREMMPYSLFRTDHGQKHSAVLYEALAGRATHCVPEDWQPQGIEHWLAHGRERRRAEFHKAVSELAIIDGSVWTRVAEPKIIIHDDVVPQGRVWNGFPTVVACAVTTLQGRYGERSVGAIGLDIDLPDTTTIYALADWEEALAHHAAIDHPDRERYSKGVYFEDVEIAEPGIFRFDAVCSPAARIAGYALKAFETDMSKWSRGDASLFMDARDALERFHDTDEVASLEHAKGLLQAFLERGPSVQSTAMAVVKRGLQRHPLDNAAIAIPVFQRQPDRRR